MDFINGLSELLAEDKAEANAWLAAPRASLFFSFLVQ
jgi:hypothetical protein